MKKNLRFVIVATSCLLLIANIALAESADNMFSQGFEKHLKGDLSGAVKLYSRAIDDNPAFAMAFQMRAIAQQQLKKYRQAINDYSMAITIGEPSFKAVSYYNRGIVKNITGDFVGAIPDFSQAIDLDKKMGVAFFHRGIAKSKTGDMEGQLDDFRRAAQLGDLNAEKMLDKYYPNWKQIPVAAPDTQKTAGLKSGNK